MLDLRIIVNQTPRLSKGRRDFAGFTLIEVLVVSLIVALLAAVAIPVYSGYVRNQRREAAHAVAQTAAITASSIKRRTGAAPTTANLNAEIFLSNASQFTVTVLGSKVFVTEASNPGDPVMDSASF